MSEIFPVTDHLGDDRQELVVSTRDIGRDAAMMTRLARLVPDRMFDRLLATNLRPHFPKERAA